MLLMSGALSCCVFIVVFLLDGWTRPGYSSARHTISALALGRRGWIQTANFIVSGTGLIAGGLGVLQAQASGFFAGMLMILGNGLVASGAFAMDPMRGYPMGTPNGDPVEFSLSHRLHDHAGLVVFCCFPLTVFAAGFTMDSLGAHIVAGVVAALLVMGVAAFGSAWEQDSPVTGLIQKAVVIGALGWTSGTLLLLGPS